MKRLTLLCTLALSFTAPVAMAQQGQAGMHCSIPADGCNMIQAVFAKTTGIKVNRSLKGSGEALAQLIGEKANPKTDVWFGGTAPPHPQAAESELAVEYRSAALPQLHVWAQQQAEPSHDKTAGICSDDFQEAFTGSESWLSARNVSVLQVKTVAARSPNEAYWQTGEFYKRAGFQPLDVFPELWSVSNPCLQLVKFLPGG